MGYIVLIVGIIVGSSWLSKLFSPVTAVVIFSVFLLVALVLGCLADYLLKNDQQVKTAIEERSKVKPKQAADYVKWKHLMPQKFKVMRSIWKVILWAGLIGYPAVYFYSFFRAADVQYQEQKTKEAAYQQMLATTQEWTADLITLPHMEDASRYVSNPEMVISQETEDSLNRLMRRFDVELGIESAVIVVNRVKDKDVFAVAQALFDQYGIGKDDRGLVLLLAYSDHAVRTHTGYKLETELTDIECSRTQETFLLPYMRSEQPDEGMLCWTNALFALLKNKEAQTDVAELPLVAPLMTASPGEEMEDSLIWLFFAAVFFVIVLIGVWVSNDDLYWWLSDRTTGNSGGSRRSGFRSGSGSGRSWSSHSGGGGGFSSGGGGYSGGGSGGGGATSHW